MSSACHLAKPSHGICWTQEFRTVFAANWWQSPAEILKWPLTACDALTFWECAWQLNANLRPADQRLLVQGHAKFRAANCTDLHRLCCLHRFACEIAVKRGEGHWSLSKLFYSSISSIYSLMSITSLVRPSRDGQYTAETRSKADSDSTVYDIKRLPKSNIIPTRHLAGLKSRTKDKYSAAYQYSFCVCTVI